MSLFGAVLLGLCLLALYTLFSRRNLKPTRSKEDDMEISAERQQEIDMLAAGAKGTPAGKKSALKSEPTRSSSAKRASAKRASEKPSDWNSLKEFNWNP